MKICLQTFNYKKCILLVAFVGIILLKRLKQGSKVGIKVIYKNFKANDLLLIKNKINT